MSRPGAPPAGWSEQCIWLRRKRRKRRRRGMLLFSSALWRSGAKIADSSSIRTGSRSTHSPVCRIVAWQTPSWREMPVGHSRYSPAEADRDRHPLHWSPYRWTLGGSTRQSSSHPRLYGTHTGQYSIDLPPEPCSPAGPGPPVVTWLSWPWTTMIERWGHN